MKIVRLDLRKICVVLALIVSVLLLLITENALAQETTSDNLATISFSLDDFSYTGSIPDEYTFVITGTNTITEYVSNNLTLYQDGYYPMVSGAMMATGVVQVGFIDVLVADLPPSDYTFDVLEMELPENLSFNQAIDCQHKNQPSSDLFVKYDRLTQFTLEANDHLHCKFSLMEQLLDDFGTVRFDYYNFHPSLTSQLVITGYDHISNEVILSDTIVLDRDKSEHIPFPVGSYEFTPIPPEGWETRGLSCFVNIEHEWEYTANALEQNLFLLGNEPHICELRLYQIEEEPISPPTNELSTPSSVSCVDIELGEYVPDDVNVSIDVESCTSNTRSAIPLSISSQFIETTESTAISLNVGVLILGLCVLSLKVCRYGRN